MDVCIEQQQTTKKHRDTPTADHDIMLRILSTGSETWDALHQCHDTFDIDTSLPAMAAERCFKHTGSRYASIQGVASLGLQGRPYYSRTCYTTASPNPQTTIKIKNNLLLDAVGEHQLRPVQSDGKALTLMRSNSLTWTTSSSTECSP